MSDLGEIIVSKGLIQAFFGLFDGHKLFAATYPASIVKHQLGAKVTKTATPPLTIAV